MKRQTISDGNIYLIAELGINHEGDIKVAETIIEQLGESGASAIKLQSFTPERYVSASDPVRLQRLGFFTGPRPHKHLKAKAQQSGLDFISTPASEDYKALSEWCDALKLPVAIDFAPTIKAAADSALPVIMSTGTAETEEVDSAVALFKSVRKAEVLEDHLYLMHCVSEYPANIVDCNLLSIPYMRERYGLDVGWSNHVIGPLACRCCFTGAKLTEVHVTDQKEGREFRSCPIV